MKLERNGIVLISVVCTLLILMLFNLLTSGSVSDIKGIFIALYFSIWVGAAVFVISTYFIPFIRDYQKNAKKKAPTQTKTQATPTPFRSPRSSLPLRERIAAYVAERRKEDGLQAPQPLRPSQTVPSGSVPSGSTGRVSRVTAPLSGSQKQSEAVQISQTSDDLGDLPLPDDFGSVGDSGDALGTLPGLDEEMDNFGDFGDEVPTESGGIEAGFNPSADPTHEPQGQVLPDIEDDLSADFGEADLINDSGVEEESGSDFSSDDLLIMDDDESFSQSPAARPGSHEGGLSEDGLSDLDTPLEPDMIDTDLSGDEDFSDIELMDFDSEELKKSKK
jgi:hypothetical protein